MSVSLDHSSTKQSSQALFFTAHHLRRQFSLSKFHQRFVEQQKCFRVRSGALASQHDWLMFATLEQAEFLL
jgi:hypothetical protein